MAAVVEPAHLKSTLQLRQQLLHAALQADITLTALAVHSTQAGFQTQYLHDGRRNSEENAIKPGSSCIQ